MKIRIMTFIAMIMAVTTITQKGNAQVKMPPASSSQTINQSLGISTISLTYSRPNMNGRQIFGNLEPFGKVWRTGANQIPNITFERELTVAGNKVQPGTYGILTIPNQDKWTIIFTKNNSQWGSYTYNEAEDLFRFDVTPEILDKPVETFTISFSEVTPSSAKMNLAWENTLVTYDLTVDEDAEIMASIQEAMKGDKKPYFAAAQYYYKNNKDTKQALYWMNKAEEEAPKAPYIKYWKALIQIKAGDKTGAMISAQQGIDLAKSENNDEYIRLNGQVLEQTSR